MANLKGQKILQENDEFPAASINNSPVIFSHQKRIIKLQPFPSLRGIMIIDFNAVADADQLVIRSEPVSEFKSQGMPSQNRALEPFNVETLKLENYNMLRWMSERINLEDDLGTQIPFEQLNQ
ncbi:MAG TPA: hypothetical protein ENJ82_15145, partial [Bacteroidetes bacterium]|nr:hypothetical protein [Bacteroidota bacterium]